MLTKEQKEARKIGGSDSATILGVNPWKTRLELYLEKIGEAEGFEGNERTEWGNRLEDAVACWYADQYGVNVRRKSKVMVHPKYDFITGTIDRLIVGENALLEIKTTDKMMTSKWADGVPAYIMPQVQHYLLFDYKYVDVAVLFGGNEAKVYRVHPDKELQEIMVDQYKYFWHCVQNRITPEPVTIGDMQKFYKDQGTTVIADTDIMQAYNEFELLKQQIKELEKIQDEYKAKICSYMGENQVLITVDGKKLVTWKEQITKRLDTKLLKEENSELYEKYLKESKSRVLRG